MEFFGIRILGLSEAGLLKIALTCAVLTLAFAARWAFRSVANLGFETTSRRTIWFRKSIRLIVGFTAGMLLLSIWFDEPRRLASFMGFLAAGLAFAAQNLVLSIAAYFVIVFGKVFDLGHRIELGGDVLDIGLVKTTIMEMGVPAALFPDPHHWIAGRQYTGRVVTVVNAEVFRQPVFNYTANFNLLWEEIRISVRYGTDLDVVERIVTAAARSYTQQEVTSAYAQLEEMRKVYLIEPADLEPSVFIRLTDNWVEVNIRFLVSTHGVRAVKDRIARRILADFRAAHIDFASQTFELVGAPNLSVRVEKPA